MSVPCHLELLDRPSGPPGRNTTAVIVWGWPWPVSERLRWIFFLRSCGRDRAGDADDERPVRRAAALARTPALVLRLGPAGDHRRQSRGRQRGRPRGAGLSVLRRLAPRWPHARGFCPRGLLLRVEPDGSLVTHGDLKQ